MTFFSSATPLMAAVAALYASVGHGGASGYLAVMSLMGCPPAVMKPAALTMNLLVAGIASIQFARAGHFRARLLWPFALASIPLSYLGARIHISPRTYGLVLGLALAAAAGRLLITAAPSATERRPLPRLPWTLGLGALLGLLSGMAGVGGGIFLSPLLLLAGWADPKETAAVSAVFIWVNSAAGLAGHLAGGGTIPPVVFPWMLAAAMGGAIGAALGAGRFPHPVLRRLLASVLLIAAFKTLTR